MSDPVLPEGWTAPSLRVPRRDQVVRVLTSKGTDHAATFVVAHTRDWPAGAAWALRVGDEVLPFEAVAGWHPDPNARPPRAANVAGGASDAATARRSRPAVLDEFLDEIARTSTVLGLLPADAMDWSPHPDVPSLRALVARLVEAVVRGGWILDRDVVELTRTAAAPVFATPRDVVAAFAAEASAVDAVSHGVDGEALAATWQLERNGSVVVSLPRGDALRRFAIAPLVYHRAETALLLTAMGIALPHPYPHWVIRESLARGESDSATGSDG